MVPVGMWKGVRYGMPIEHGNFQQMYINVDMFKKAGLNPDDPPKTFDEWLPDMKKLTIADPRAASRRRWASPSAARALRWDHGQVPALRPRLGRPDAEPGDGQGDGYANSPQMVAALTFFGDLVLKDKVAASRSAIPRMPSARNGRRDLPRVVVLRLAEEERADVNFKVYALPCEKACPGAGRCFPGRTWLQEQPEQAGGVGVLPVHQQCQGRHGASSAAGDTPVWTANLDSAYVKARPDFQSTKDMLAAAGAADLLPPKSNELATAFGEAVVGVLFGKGQPKPLLDEAAAKMDRILKD
jgi:ABC-type glycerol-3-phosphate transport system substrate-binding protein